MLLTPEQYETFKHPFNAPTNSKYGAPMGRSNTQGPDDIKTRYNFYTCVNFHCVKVPLNEGYDKGGSYWGMNDFGTSLYCVHAFQHIDGTANNFRAQYFVRAANRNEAKLEAKEYFGEMITFYR